MMRTEKYTKYEEKKILICITITSGISLSKVAVPCKKATLKRRWSPHNHYCDDSKISSCMRMISACL